MATIIWWFSCKVLLKFAVHCCNLVLLYHFCLTDLLYTLTLYSGPAAWTDIELWWSTQSRDNADGSFLRTSVTNGSEADLSSRGIHCKVHGSLQTVPGGRRHGRFGCCWPILKLKLYLMFGIRSNQLADSVLCRDCLQNGPSSSENIFNVF